MAKLKRGDEVIVIAGKDKGRQGKLLRVFPSTQRVLVENINLIKKHVKPVPSRDKPSGIITKEAPIHVSNVSIKNPETGKPDRVGFRMIDGLKRRICKSNGALIDEHNVSAR